MIRRGLSFNEIMKILQEYSIVKANLYDGYAFYLVEAIPEAKCFYGKFMKCNNSATERIDYSEIKELIYE